jgi:hypothetical protein
MNEAGEDSKENNSIFSTAATIVEQGGWQGASQKFASFPL